MKKCMSALLALLPLLAPAQVKEYVEPVDTATVDVSGWDSVTGAPRLTWASKNVHYRQFATPPSYDVADTVINVWRGERVGLEALMISPEATAPLSVSLSDFMQGKRVVDAPGSHASWMRYVTTTSWNACGYPSDTLPTYTVPDMIDLTGVAAAMPARSVRPIWCTIEVPRGIAPGAYDMTLTVTDQSSHRKVGELKVTLNVNERVLPEPKDYAFYLDLWQQPYSVSRYYGVRPWSKEHLELMRPYMDMLARAGQKTVSVILFYEPWGEQSNDKFEPMVQTTLRRDGSWDYDYTILDRYVEFMAESGIDANLSCFTMIPWEMKFRYFDESKGDYDFLATTSDSPEYKALWTDFLQKLTAHLKQKGWYDKTMIVMDERGLPDMLNAYRVAKEAVPGIKMSLAGSYHKELIDSLESYTLIKGDFFPEDVMKRRHEKDFITLMYTCCATPAPSQFSNSAPADGAYLPVYATATGHDGYLHWSYMNWTDNPLEDTRFRMFAPGDTYFIYPDGRSSIRYERMVEGIQMSEKLRMLREEMVAAKDIEGLQRLENALLPIRSGAMNEWYPTSAVVDQLQEAIDGMSK